MTPFHILHSQKKSTTKEQRKHKTGPRIIIPPTKYHEHMRTMRCVFTFAVSTSYEFKYEHSGRSK